MSIAFSTAATVLIMAGWAKRRKLEDEVELPEPEVEAAFELDDLGDLGEATREIDVSPEPEPADTAELPALKKKKAPSASTSKSGSGRKKVVVVPGRGRYHTAECRFAKHPAAERITAAVARKRGLDPCSVCKPA